MKKPLIVLASSAVLGLAAAPAMAQQRGPIVDYVTGQLVWSDIEDFDEALALAIAAGKTFTPNFSVEGEITTTLSAAEAEGDNGDTEVTYWTAGVYGVYVLPVGQNFALRGRLGGLYRDAEVDNGGDSDLDDDEFGVSFGVGGLYDLSSRLNVVAEYTRIDDDINHISAGVQLKF
jgi:hypothetical protein